MKIHTSKTFKNTITIYNYCKNTKTLKEYYKRTVLEKCFYNNSLFKKTGVQVKDNAQLFILFNEKYISYKDWNLLDSEEIEDDWTIAIGSDRAPTYIVFSDCPFEFYWSDTTEMRLQIRAFEEAYIGKYKRAKDINEQFFGGKDMWHIEVNI